MYVGIRNKKLAVYLTEQQYELFMENLKKNNQPLSEFVVYSLSNFINGSYKVEKIPRVRGIRKQECLHIKVSEWLYGKVDEIAKVNNCSISAVVYAAIKDGFRE